MLCEKYTSLSIPERTTIIGELVHSLQNDNDCFIALLDVIRDAKEKGIFSGVKINPPKEN